jgi:outer membrane protein TolC
MTSPAFKTPAHALGRIAAAAILSTTVLLSACSVTPQRATPDEVRARVKSDTDAMYLNQAPITAALSLEEAMARTLKYNLDYRLKKMESALALGLADYSNFEMLPNLLATAGYRNRSNFSGGSAVGVFDGVESLRASSSEDKQHRTSGAEFSWNILDFGVSYYRARQQADQFLVAEERRRKVVHNMVQDVRAAYWRALGAQRMSEQAKDILQRANLALARSREAEAQRVIAPALALNYQRALLDATSLLNTRRQDLEFAKRELASLMNLEPGVNFVLAEAAEAALPAAPTDVAKLEELALLQRPELREEDFKKRITADEARRQLLGLLPGISLDVGVQQDSNHLLAFNNWSQGGMRVSWNLMRLAAYPSLDKAQKSQEQTDQVRRMALSMAVLTQVRIGAERYRFAVEDFKLAEQAAQVDKRLADNMRASVTVKLESELEAIRTQARAVLGSYQRMTAYANAQIAFGRLYSTLGFDPLPDDFEKDDVPTLAARVRVHLKATEKESLKMSSQLFGHLPSVAIKLVGVGDAVQKVRMHADVAELLKRNMVEIDAEHGLPLTLTLQHDAVLAHGSPQTSLQTSLQTATWQIAMSGAQGQALGTAEHSATLPSPARASAYESALVAAVTSKLPQMRSWLATQTDAPTSTLTSVSTDTLKGRSTGTLTSLSTRTSNQDAP